MRVCVIGAGAAGLCAARRVASVKSWPDPVVYEQSGQIGGTWVYTPETGPRKCGAPVTYHSSMYKNMKTNLPKEVMGFPDFPFWVEGPSFISHYEVVRYLENYCSKFDLRRFIKFSTNVLSVKPIAAEDDEQDDGESDSPYAPRWIVSTLETETNVTQSATFDAVFVCNGHYSTPHLPRIPGQESFEGAIIHSHWYRRPEPYQHKTVACLGAGPSGTDIGLEIADVAKQVYLCHNGPRMKTRLPANVAETMGINSLSRNHATFNDGTEIPIDALILCTGYKFTFDFLTGGTDVSITVAEDGHHVTPLYRQLFHPNFQNLFLIGLPCVVIPFPIFDTQVRYCLQILQKAIQLPSPPVLMERIQREYIHRLETLHFPPQKSHFIAGPLQWEYLAALAEEGQMTNLVAPVISRLYDHVHAIRKVDLPGYKRHNFRLVDNDHFECLETTRSEQY